MTDHPVARRTLIKSASLGISAGLASGLASAQAQPAAAQVPGGAAPGRWRPCQYMESGEYWAHKADVKLYVFRKRIGAPAAGEPPRPVLFLVHGSSNSARSSYDVTLPGKADYSLMNVFAGYGFDVWTMDHNGYGRSDSSGNNSDIASGVADLKAALPVVAQETGRQKVHMFGTSSGAIRAAAYAQAEPERRPARLLPSAAERRPRLRHSAARRAQCRIQQEPAPAVVRDAQFFGGAAAGWCVADARANARYPRNSPSLKNSRSSR